MGYVEMKNKQKAIASFLRHLKQEKTPDVRGGTV